MAAGNIKVIFQVLAKNTQAITKLENQVSGFGKKFASVMKAMGKISAAVAVAVAVGKMIFTFERAAIKMQQLDNRMKAAVLTQQQFVEATEFTSEISKRMGLRIMDVKEGFSGFAAAALRSNLTMEQTKQIFSDVSEAAVALQLPGERLKLIFNALQQMSSKGVVSMEELRRQMADSLPGALQIGARAVNRTTASFIKMVSEGKVLSDEFLPLFAAQIKRELGGSFDEASRSTQANLNRMETEWTKFSVAVGEVSLPALNALAEGFSKGLTPKITKAIEKFTEWRNLSEGLDGQIVKTEGEIAKLAGAIERTEEAFKNVDPKFIQPVELEQLKRARLELEDLNGALETLQGRKQAELDAPAKAAAALAAALAAAAEDKAKKASEAAKKRQAQMLKDLAALEKVKGFGPAKQPVDVYNDGHDLLLASILDFENNRTKIEADAAQRRKDLMWAEFQMKESIVRGTGALTQETLGMLAASLDAETKFAKGLQVVSAALALIEGAVAGAMAIKTVWASSSSWQEGLAVSLVVGAEVAAATAALVSSIKSAQFAKGTSSAPGGMALVGEQGPELVNLPRGSQVFTAGQSQRMIQNSTDNSVSGVTFQINDQVTGQRLVSALRSGGLRDFVVDLKGAMASV